MSRRLLLALACGIALMASVVVFNVAATFGTRDVRSFTAPGSATYAVHAGRYVIYLADDGDEPQSVDLADVQVMQDGVALSLTPYAGFNDTVSVGEFGVMRGVATTNIPRKGTVQITDSAADDATLALAAHGHQLHGLADTIGSVVFSVGAALALAATIGLLIGALVRRWRLVYFTARRQENGTKARA